MPTVRTTWAACIRTGKGLPQDYNESVNWYRKAAEQGYAPCSGESGLRVCRHGRGVAQDYKEAVKWNLKSAEQGNAQGQFNLGFMSPVLAKGSLRTTSRPSSGTQKGR